MAPCARVYCTSCCWSGPSIVDDERSGFINRALPAERELANWLPHRRIFLFWRLLASAPAAHALWRRHDRLVTMAARKTMRLGLSVLFSLPFSSGFIPLNKCPSFLRLPLANSNDDTEKKEQQPPNGLDQSERKRRKRMKRRVDYPSFAYDARGQYESMRRYKPDAAYKRPGEVPRTVSIPEKVPTVQKLSLFDRIIDAITSPNFGLPYEIQSVTKSAQKTRLLNNRCYARKEPFVAENIAVPPSLSDLSPPPSQPLDRIWISSTFRIGSFLLAFCALPLLTEFLSNFVTMEPDELDEITGRFSPGISILYGTFVSLTLSILYNRQQAIQSNVSQESSLLTLLIRNMLSLCKDDKELAVRAGQCAADQIRTLVRTSRGGELLLMMYSDPYDRMLELLDLKEDDYIAKGQTDLGGKGVSRERERERERERVGVGCLSDVRHTHCIQSFFRV